MSDNLWDMLMSFDFWIATTMISFLVAVIFTSGTLLAVDNYDVPELDTDQELSSVIDQGNRVGDQAIDMENAELINYFHDSCPPGQSVKGVNSNGSYKCQNVGKTLIDEIIPSDFNTYQDLESEGRLDNNNGSDILVRDQADSRFIKDGADVIGSLRVDNSGHFTVASVSADYFKENGTKISDLYLSQSGGSLSGVLNMTGHRIKNVPAPQSGGDAVNKSYVDNNDQYEADTTIADNQTLDETLQEGNTAQRDIDMNNNSIRNVTLEAVRVPVGVDAYK